MEELQKREGGSPANGLTVQGSTFLKKGVYLKQDEGLSDPYYGLRYIPYLRGIELRYVGPLQGFAKRDMQQQGEKGRKILGKSPLCVARLPLAS